MILLLLLSLEMWMSVSMIVERSLVGRITMRWMMMVMMIFHCIRMVMGGRSLRMRIDVWISERKMKERCGSVVELMIRLSVWIKMKSRR